VSEEEAKPGGRGRSGTQSLDAALRLLLALGSLRRPATLSELARLVDMPPSKVHRYLASFAKAGLVAQRHRSGRYELGRSSLDLGLSAMANLDLVNRAADRLEEIVDATGAAALLAVWGTFGPTVVRWQRTPGIVAPSLGLGTTFPLLNSASGRVFLTYAAPRIVEALLEEELGRARASGLSWPDLEPTRAAVACLRETIRARGYASVDGRFIPGLNAASVPVLNWQGEVEAAVTIASGEAGLLDPEGPALRLLLRIGRDLSFADPQSRGPA